MWHNGATPNVGAVSGVSTILAVLGGKVLNASEVLNGFLHHVCGYVVAKAPHHATSCSQQVVTTCWPCF